MTNRKEILAEAVEDMCGLVMIVLSLVAITPVALCAMVFDVAVDLIKGRVAP